MKIYLVRHGEAEHNVGKGYTVNEGKSDLTKKGIKQSESLAKRLKAIPIDVIVSSTFGRAEQTAAIIYKKKLEAKLLKTPLLNELRFPSAYVGKSWDDVLLIPIKEGIARHRFDKDWHYSDEENSYDFLMRIMKAIGYLEKTKKENVLVVAHGAVIRTMVSVLIMKKNPHYKDWVNELGQLALDKMILHLSSSLVTENTGITVCEKRDGEHHWRLVTWNDFSHL